MFDLKFHNTQRKQFLFDDSNDVLELVKTPVGPDMCNSCWSNSEIIDYSNWHAKDKYTITQTGHLHEPEPFTYNPFTRTCDFNCKPGYWASAGSIHYHTEDVSKDRCIYDNCKNWNPNDTSPDNSNKKCTECWDHKDVQYYFRWHAKEAYTQKEIYGIDAATPFTLKDDHTCKMNCKNHYWSNWHIASEPNDQRCTHVNCKAFDYNDQTAFPYHCTECWAKADVSLYDNMQCPLHDTMIGTWPDAILCGQNDYKG
jgi:hypothetical protein